MKSLQTTFDPRTNALNAVRLALAVGVILWHSVPLTGNELHFSPAKQILGNVFVDGFFAISGFLILASWTRHPRWWWYLQARILRIMPAYYVCLISTAAIFAPLSLLLMGNRYTDATASSSVSYVMANSMLKMRQYGISGTLTNVPYPNVWNGSLWTLWWEFLCYLGILALGVTRLLKFRGTLPIAFALAMGAEILLKIDLTGNNFVNTAPRFATMFLAGSLVFQYRSKLPVSGTLVGAAFAIIVLSSVLPDYRIVAALPLAYALICAGAMMKSKRLVLRNDVSYGIYIYAFPTQQIVATLSGQGLGIFGFFVVSTLATVPIAAASWFSIERPALRLKKRSSARTMPPPSGVKPFE